MISDTLKKLISSPVDPSVKLTGVGVFLGKVLDRFDSRVSDLESRQLQKGDKGDRGDSVTVDDVKPLLDRMYSDHLLDQKDDLKEIMVKNWRTW